MKRLCLVIAFLFVAATPGYAAVISVQPSPLNVSVGQSFSINVDISNVSDLYTFHFDIGFDPAVVSPVSVAEGGFLPSGGTTSFGYNFVYNSGSSGLTAYAISIDDLLATSGPGVSGTGTLATINFNALAIGNTLITISNELLSDASLDTIPASIQNGNISVQPVNVPEPPSTLYTALSLILAILLAKRGKRFRFG